MIKNFYNPVKNNLEAKPEANKDNLNKLILEIKEELKKQGIIVTDELRINEDAFEGLYTKGTIQRDKKTVADKESGWSKKKEETNGEQLEMLKTVLFNKFLGESHCVVRSARFDDMENGVDNVIINKESGDIICAFDEVCDIKSKYYFIKQDKILKINQKGCRLKYGIEIKEVGGDKKIKTSSIKSLPIFYLALDEKKLKEGIANLSPSLKEKTQFEKNLFKYFVYSLKGQISLLNNQITPPLSPNMKNKIKAFEKELEKF
jgi:hypothetical protein